MTLIQASGSAVYRKISRAGGAHGEFAVAVRALRGCRSGTLDKALQTFRRTLLSFFAKAVMFIKPRARAINDLNITFRKVRHNHMEAV